MKEGLFLGVSCIVTTIAKGSFSLEGLQIEEYTGIRADIGKMNKDGSWTILTEKEWAKEKLENGQGVMHEGNIYFSKEQAGKSQYYFQFKKAYSVYFETLSKPEQFLMDSLYDIKYFFIAKSTLNLVEQEFFTKKQALQKLTNYSPTDKAIFLLNDLLPNRVAV